MVLRLERKRGEEDAEMRAVGKDISFEGSTFFSSLLFFFFWLAHGAASGTRLLAGGLVTKNHGDHQATAVRTE